MRWALLLLTACGRLGFDGGESPDVDARGPDGTTDFCTTGAPAACPTGAVFCEDFETSTGASFPNWDSVAIKNWYTNGAADPTTQIDATGTPCRGAKAAHGHSVGEAQVAMLHKSVAARPPSLYVRMWFRIAASSSEGDVELLGVHDSTTAQFINVGAMRGSQVLGINIVGFSSAAAGIESPATLVVDRWTCLELGVRFDKGTSGQIQLWLDDSAIADFNNVTTEGTLTLDEVLVGVISGMPETGTFDLNFDEVAFSGTRIGCN